MLQYSIFICIPSDLVLLAQVRQQPNADPSQSNVYFPELAYNYHDRFLYPILHRSELQIHQRWRTLRCKRCICTSTRFLRVRILPSVPVPLAPEHLQPKPFLSALVLLWAQQSALM